MEISDFRALFFDQLRDLYSVELQLEESIPELTESAVSDTLRARLGNHLEETKKQRERLERIFNEHEEDFNNDQSKAMKGLIKGGDQHIEMARLPLIRDSIIIAHCLRIEHYEIAGYTVLVTLANELGLTDEEDILRQSMEEEQEMSADLHDYLVNKLLPQRDRAG